LSGTVHPTGPSAPTISLPTSAKLNWTIDGIPHYFVIINTTPKTSLGLYNVTILGVSGSISHTATVTVGVTDVSVPPNGAELVYRANFTSAAYAGRSVVLNNIFQDLGSVPVGVSNVTLSISFGTFRDTGGPHILDPFQEKPVPLTFTIPPFTSPGNYSVTVTVRWFLGPGSLYSTPGPDLVTQGSIRVYSNPLGPLGALNFNGLASIMLGVLGGVATSAAIMFLLLTVMERRRRDPFRNLPSTSGPPQPKASMKSCHYCGKTVPVTELCAECGSRLY
jgi:hypothetical protein